MPDTNTQPTNQLTKEYLPFGQYLKDERLRQGYSVEEISQKTGIKLENLISIENSERRKLPADAFNRGFIKLYAKILEIDPQESLESYTREWGFTNGMRGGDIFSDAQSMAEPTSIFADRQFLGFLLIVILVASIFFAYKFISLEDLQRFNFSSNDKNSVNQEFIPPEPQKEPVTQEEVAVPVPPPVETAIEVPLKEPQSPAENNNIEPPEEFAAPQQQEALEEGQIQAPSQQETVTGDTPHDQAIQEQEQEKEQEDHLSGQDTAEANYTLEAVFKEITWLRITLDDQEPLEYTFRAGEKQTWSASESVDLFIGNAGGLQLTLNGNPIEITKSSGQTLKLSIP